MTSRDVVSATHPDTRLVVSPRGAGIRSLEIHGHTVVPDYLGSDAPGYAGVVMFPWAGRVPHGRWVDGEDVLELPITDEETPSALHGLVCCAEWDVTRHDTDVLELGYTLEATDGYPYSLRIEVAYSLVSDRLVVKDTVTNIGERSAPFAVAHHPYFALGGAKLSELHIDASIVGTMERSPQKIPLSRRGFGPSLRPVSLVDIDDSYLLESSAEKLVTYRLQTPQGTIELWQEGEWRWLHVYSTNNFPSIAGPIPVVALEPHTAVPNSLNWPDQLIRVEPGARWSGQWGISFSTPQESRQS